MTEWHEAYTDINHKPEAVDTTSSPTTVYLRKDFEEVEMPNDTMGEEEPTGPKKQWKYLERTCSHEEYNTASLSTEMIVLRRESEIIDEYTEELMEGGLL